MKIMLLTSGAGEIRGLKGYIHDLRKEHVQKKYEEVKLRA